MATVRIQPTLTRRRLETAALLQIFVAACLAWLPQNLAAQDSAAEMEREFQTAMAAQQKGDLERSNAILLSLRHRHAGVFAIDESLGMNYAAQEKYAEALPMLQAAVNEDPSSDVALANLGAAFFKLHRNQEALKAFEDAARLNPKNVATQQSLGQVALEDGKPARAAQAFEAALAIRPDDQDLRLNCATALVAAGQSDKAKDLLAAVPNAGNLALAQSLLGEIEEKKGNYQEAVAHFTHAAEIDPSEANVWAVGVEFLRHWTFEAAIREFEFATAQFPGSVRMKLGLGAAYFGGGRYAQAIPVFGDLLHTDKDNALYAEMLGMACTAVTESAQKQCGPLLTYAQAHPRDARAATYAASMLLTERTSDRQNELARKLLTSALAANPRLADAHYRMGILEQNEGNWAASIPDLQRAVALKPNFAQAHYRLALAYWRAGRKADGQSEMDLEKQYAQQAEDDLNARLRQITTFIVDSPN
jgi:tetratricopeptide (TPR) repeat protein